MLFILYGAASELGYKSRMYLEKKGIETIDKYTYCSGDVIAEARFGTRDYLSWEEFEKKTDSLFRYEFANMILGFDWSQITDAVYSDGKTEKKNKLLTLATSNVNILRKIKEVYPNDVKIIYFHIDTVCLENMYAKIPDITPEEFGIRMATGKQIKDVYTANADVFDYTVIYGGESSVFDFEAVCKQYDAILKTIEHKHECITNVKYDVFISYSMEQKVFAEKLIAKLQKSGLKVFLPDNILLMEGNYVDAIRNAMLNSKIYVPIVSNKALDSKFFMYELEMFINSSKNSGTVIRPIAYDYEDLNWDAYNSILGYATIGAYPVDKSNYAKSIEDITEWIHDMFSTETSLGNLSSKVKEYSSAGLWKKAAEVQEQYIEILEKYMSILNKEDNSMLTVAQNKYSDLLLQNNESAVRDESSTSEPLVDKIANYGKATIELFEALFENGLAPGYRETLISAYDRILGYCKSVNLGNEIPEICIDKIAELKNSTISNEISECGENTLQSLKVYLGQALPNTGIFDVFISHKSEDDEIATKVYDYLRQTGRVVFCDHFSLPEMHDSQYDIRIVEALGNSKHLVVVASDPEYLKSNWVYTEWHGFYNDKRLGIRNGNLILVLSDDAMRHIGDLPAELRDGIEIIKTSEFRSRLNDYLW